jgi:hypothetical protein
VYDELRALGRGTVPVAGLQQLLADERPPAAGHGLADVAAGRPDHLPDLPRHVPGLPRLEGHVRPRRLRPAAARLHPRPRAPHRTAFTPQVVVSGRASGIGNTKAGAGQGCSRKGAEPAQVAPAVKVAVMRAIATETATEISSSHVSLQNPMSPFWVTSWRSGGRAV